MKKIFALLLCLTFMSTVAFAGDISTTARESRQGSISATQVEASTVVKAKHLLLINDGANSVYIKINSDTAVTTGGFKLVKDASVVLDTVNEIYNVRTICAAGETATVRYLAWE